MAKKPVFGNHLNTRFSKVFNTPEFQKPFFRNWLITAGVFALGAAIGTGVYYDSAVNRVKKDVYTIVQNYSSTISNEDTTLEKLQSILGFINFSINYKNEYVTENAEVLYNEADRKIEYESTYISWLSGSEVICKDEAISKVCVDILAQEGKMVYSNPTYVGEKEFWPGALYEEVYEQQEDGSAKPVMNPLGEVKLPKEFDQSAYELQEDYAAILAGGVASDSELLELLRKTDLKVDDQQDGVVNLILPKSNKYIVVSAPVLYDNKNCDIVTAFSYDFWGECGYNIYIVYAVCLLLSLIAACIFTYLRYQEKLALQEEETQDMTKSGKHKS